MNQNVPVFLRDRAAARSRGDVNLARAIDADLARVGYVERIETPQGLETTAVRAPETATPNRAGRPPLPRCEHGKTPGRCRHCPQH